MVAPWEMEWASPAPSRLPRGLRNNNPLNLEATVNWTGMQGNDGRFAVFPDLETGVAAADRNLQTYHQKHGLNTVEGVINRWAPPTENDSRAYATRVSQTLGVDPAAPLDMSDPGVRRALLDAMADVENGQSVDLGSGPASPAPWEMAWEASPAAPPARREIARSRSGGVTIDVEPATAPTIAQDAVSGLLAPFKTLGRDVVDDYRRVTSRAGQPLPSIPEAFMQSVEDFGSKARIIGDVLGLAGAPVMAAVRPASRAVNRTGVPIYERPKLQDIGKGKAPQRITDPNQRQAVIEGTINTALSAAKPASPAGRAPAAKPMTLEQLQKAKTAAYQAVDDLGVAYSPKAGATLADSIGYDLATKRINAKVTPKAHAVMEDVIEQLRAGNPIRLDQLDDMRQQVWRATGEGDDAEQFFGKRIRDLIDEFVDNAGPGQILNGDGPQAASALATARDLNTRWRKAQEVTNRVESADLRAASTYAGGNKANAARQKLRPLIDPKSNQRIRNLTPAERAALNKVVRGTGGANAARVTGKLLDPRGLLGAAVQTIGGSTTGGLSTLSIPLGMAASEASNALTMKSVNDLLRLISMGGAKPGSLPPINSILSLGGRPAIPLRSIPGLVGASEVAAPLARIPSAPPKKKAATKARAAPRRK